MRVPEIETRISVNKCELWDLMFGQFYMLRAYSTHQLDQSDTAEEYVNRVKDHPTLIEIIERTHKLYNLVGQTEFNNFLENKLKAYYREMEE